MLKSRRRLQRRRSMAKSLWEAAVEFDDPVASQFRDALVSGEHGDIGVLAHGGDYDDYRNHLVDWDEYERDVDTPKPLPELEAVEQVIKVINAYNRIALPRYWGSGKSASADSTKSLPSEAGAQ